jgi:hypothetical protein
MRLRNHDFITLLFTHSDLSLYITVNFSPPTNVPNEFVSLCPFGVDTNELSACLLCFQLFDKGSVYCTAVIGMLNSFVILIQQSSNNSKHTHTLSRSFARRTVHNILN